MGAAASLPDPDRVHFANTNRFGINDLAIHETNIDNEATATTVTTGKTRAPSVNATKVLSVTPNDDGIRVTSDDLVEYVQDPNGGLLLKIPYSPNIMFNFSLSLTVSASSPISNLTFISAPSSQNLDNFITNEFFHNPNIQNEDNVVLLGDFISDDQDHDKSVDVNFVWHWTAPPQNPNPSTTQPKGWKTVVCFAEYDKHKHTLQQLARFPVWIQGPPEPWAHKIRIPSNPLTASSPSPPPTQYATSPITTSTTFAPPHSVLAAALEDQAISPLNTQVEALREAADPQKDKRSSLQLKSAAGSAAGSPAAPGPAATGTHTQLSASTSTGSAPAGAPATVPRPADDSVAQPEDGPLFRATINSLEKRTGGLKIKVKKLLKRAIMLQERNQALIEVLPLFSQSLREVADTEIASFQSIVYSYFDPPESGYRDLVDLLRRNCQELQIHIIEPLRKLYDLEIKSFDLRKREFDDESSQYYSWLSRYLSMKQETKGKKKVESDSKYNDKRKAFELCRFDYYSYMQDLHGGRKQHDVSYHLALFAQSQVDRVITVGDRFGGSIKPQVDAILREIKDANKDWTRQRTEREVRRRALERTVSIPGGASQGMGPGSATASGASGIATGSAAAAGAGVGGSIAGIAGTGTGAGVGVAGAASGPTSASAHSLAQVTSPGVSGTGHFAPGTSLTSGSPSVPVAQFDKLAVGDEPRDLHPYNPSEYSATTAPQPIPPRNQSIRASTGLKGPPLRVSTTGDQNHVVSPSESVLSPDPASSVDRQLLNPWDPKSSATTGPENNGILGHHAVGSVPSAGTSISGSVPTLVDSSGQSEGERRREGLLWAMSRPGGVSDQLSNLKQGAGWHKFWVVLAGGMLCEYTNWKQGLDLHNEPINLKVALVREARNAERRFCFEVVTPNYKRVYQAPNEEDMQMWIKAINYGITQSLEAEPAKLPRAGESPVATTKMHRVFSRASGSNQYDDDVRSPSGHGHGHGHHGSHGTGGNGHDDGKKGLVRAKSGAAAAIGVGATVGAAVGSTTAGPNSGPGVGTDSGQTASAHSSPITQSPVENDIKSLLPSIRQIHPSNQLCADCGSSVNVEWISINLLVILCIDCSGVHRSLGSHISKIRSLRFDTNSFTTELVELIKAVNNAAINAIWERAFNGAKPQITADNRASFITEKYIERKFTRPSERPNATLRQGVGAQDVLAILAALASRANPNSSIDSTTEEDGAETTESVLIYALRKAPVSSVIFPIAELLLLNSATLPSAVPSTPPLTPAAHSYLQRKISAQGQNGTSTSANAGTGANATSLSSASTKRNPSHASHASPGRLGTKRLSVGRER